VAKAAALGGSEFMDPLLLEPAPAGLPEPTGRGGLQPLELAPAPEQALIQRLSAS